MTSHAKKYTLDLSHEPQKSPEEKTAVASKLAPRKANLPPLDQLNIDKLDDTKYWVWSLTNNYSHAQAYVSEAEADRVAAEVGRNPESKVLVLTPKTIQMAKEAPDRGQSLWETITSYFSSKGSLTMGTSGFGHEAWLVKFYPKATLQKDRLAYYATRFGAVEITATRHSTPPTRVLENWAAMTPPSFMFCFCAPVTVRPSNDRAAEIMRSFMRRIAAVGNKLGPVALHIGPLERYNDGDAKRFFDSLPPHRYAVHVESEEWQNQEVLDEMLSRGIVAIDTELGSSATDCLGWSYKRIASDLIVRRPRMVGKNSTEIVFVVDPRGDFVSQDAADALKDQGLVDTADGVMTLIPNSMGTGGGFPTGMGNSGKSSGTEVADGISLEPGTPNHKKVKKDFGSDVANTATMSVGDKENNADGKSKPFGNNVDGKTSDSSSYTDPNSGF